MDNNLNIMHNVVPKVNLIKTKYYRIIRINKLHQEETICLDILFKHLVTLTSFEAKEGSKLRKYLCDNDTHCKLIFINM